MPAPRTPLVLAAALTALAVDATAQTITVGPPGSGAQFDEIQDGIAAAPPGGLVLVAPGGYIDVGTLLIDKPLTLLARGASYEAVAGSPFDVPLPLAVLDLPAGERVVVEGLTLISSGFFGQQGSSVVVADCAGTVVLRDLTGQGNTFAAAQAQVRNSALVVLENCAFQSGGSSTTTSAGLLAQHSRVHLLDCTLTGGYAWAAYALSPDGAPGLLAENAIVRLARTELRGGYGASANLLFPIAGTDGGPGVAATASQILLRGGPGNLVAGGDGGVGGNLGTPVHGAGGAAIDADATSFVVHTPDVVLEPGQDGNATTTGPLFAGPAPVLPLPQPLPTITASAANTAPGAAAAFDLDGEPGAICLPLLALDLQPGFALPEVLGWLTISGPDLAALPTAVLDPGGAGSVAVTLPPNPLLVGTVAHVQAFSFAPSGQIAVSLATTFAVR